MHQKAEEGADAKREGQEEEEEEADQVAGGPGGSWEAFGSPFGNHRGLLRGLQGSRRALGRLSGLHWGFCVIFGGSWEFLRGRRRAGSHRRMCQTVTGQAVTLTFADSVSLFHVFGRRRREKAQAGGRPGGMQERPGRTPGGARSSKTCRFERILPGSLLVPQSNTPPRGRRIASRIPPGQVW